MSADNPQQRPGAPGTQQLTIKIDDETARGVYFNRVMIGHTAEEFIFDFIAEFPPGPQVVSRVVTSPRHAAALLDALAENMSRFEKQFGSQRTPRPSGSGPSA